MSKFTAQLAASYKAVTTGNSQLVMRSGYDYFIIPATQRKKYELACDTVSKHLKNGKIERV